jgi:cytochrome P450
MEFGGQKLAAGDLVLVSFAAANTDPALAASRHASSNRSHLAWSAGPHACPAKDPARLITVTAIENLFNRLPDVELAVPEDSLTWRPGPFNRALAALPARFTPVRATRQPDPQHRPETTAHSGQGGAQGRQERGGLWSSFLSWWKA